MAGDLEIDQYVLQWMVLNVLTLVNVGQDSIMGNCDVSKKFVQFLIVPDGELQMTGNDTGLPLPLPLPPPPGPAKHAQRAFARLAPQP